MGASIELEEDIKTQTPEVFQDCPKQLEGVEPKNETPTSVLSIHALEGS